MRNKKKKLKLKRAHPKGIAWREEGNRKSDYCIFIHPAAGVCMGRPDPGLSPARPGPARAPGRAGPSWWRAGPGRAWIEAGRA
jgi:hypothetical protein